VSLREYVSKKRSGWAAENLDYLVVIDGLSKSHAMSGWRMGWTVAPEKLTRHLGNFLAMSVFGCPQFIQDASAFALNNDEYYVSEMREKYRKRRDAVCDRLKAMPKFKFHKPDAGMFVMIDMSVLPGSAFGDSTRGHVRFSLVQPMEVIMEGCKRLEHFALGGNA